MIVNRIVNMSSEIVRGVKEMLIARGQTFTTNEDAFAITGRVAWALRVHGAMLIMKNASQNGAVYRGVKYSHDAIAFSSGWIDCLAGAGPPDNRNEPAWNPTGMSGAVLVPPFDLDAGTEEPSEPTEPEEPAEPVDPPPPPVDDDDLLQVLAAVVRLVKTVVADLRSQREDLRVLSDALTLDRVHILTGLQELRETQKAGLSGTVFGARVTLKPPA